MNDNISYANVRTVFTSSSCSISDPTAWYITVNHCSNPPLNPAVQSIVILTADISNSRGADGGNGEPIRKLLLYVINTMYMTVSNVYYNKNVL